METHHYFFAMFGDPKPPEKDEVESGVYHPDSKAAPFPCLRGDILLLYCTGGYAGHEMQVPGIGVVAEVDDETVRYRYVLLPRPIPKKRIEECFAAEDLKKYRNRKFSTFWLFEISKESFTRTVDTASLDLS